MIAVEVVCKLAGVEVLVCTVAEVQVGRIAPLELVLVQVQHK